MNEQIKELARQAGGFIDLNQHVGGEKGCMVYTYEGLEQFAESIVLECIRYFNEEYTRDFDTLWREDLTKGIKQHFGIKE